MTFKDLEIPEGKIENSAKLFLNRALEESRRRKYPLTGELLFLVFVKIDWEFFATLMYDLNFNPHEITNEVEEFIQNSKSMSSEKVLAEAKLFCRLALHHATSMGRLSIEPIDIFASIFEHKWGAVAEIFKKRGVEPEKVAVLIDSKIKKDEEFQEEIKKRYDLPVFLKQFGTNLNLLARQKKLAPFFGRDTEIRQTVEILSHRQRSNSVILIGEAGVGKTAIIEGLAMKMEFSPEELPIGLSNCQIISIPMNRMVAGTMLRGMFEDRIEGVIKELKEHPNFIAFVDEAQTLIGAGSAMGAPTDAATMFKTSLARGEIRMIASATLAEYKQYIAEDEALARRFGVVYVEEPTVAQTRDILMNIKKNMERVYSVNITDEAIEMALVMSSRYERHLHLPDKVIGWLDTACVRVEIDKTLNVTADTVIGVIADKSKLPPNMVSRKSAIDFEVLEKSLGQRVVGQLPAIRAVATRLVLNMSPLKENFNRPDGVLLFLGPTGVGKTELAKALAEFLFGDENKMIRIDMSEYGSHQGVEKLIGAPRGVVGSERGGILTNQLRNDPYSVVLFDEIEKAEPSLWNLFLQAFDEGWLTDGRGRRVYLSDAIIVMTSNLGSNHFKKLTNPLGFASQKGSIVEQIAREVKKDMEKTFSPEFINRIDEVVVFSPLTEDEVRRIAVKHIDSIKLVLSNAGKVMMVDQDALDKLVKDGHSLAFGARYLKRMIDSKIKIPISLKFDKFPTFHVVFRNGQVEVDAISELGKESILLDPRYQKA